MLPILLVAAQIALIAAVALPWKAASFHGEGWVAIALAAALGAWALTTNRPGNFSVLPEPRANARLVTGGAYRIVRHPMYLAVLIFALGCAIGWRTVVHGVVFVALSLVLHVKAGIEERALRERFPEYADYCARTPRIVPFVRRL